MWRAKENFLWYRLGAVIPDNEIEEHPNWKEFCEEQIIKKPELKPVEVVKEEVKVEEVPLDLNKDKVVDSKDAKIASKVMNEVKKKKKKEKFIYNPFRRK